MYCILRYIDYTLHKRFRDESVSVTRCDQSVNCPDTDTLNSTLYFNPNCILQLILDYICSEAHIDMDDDCYDLCASSGNLLNIKNYKPSTSGLTIFQQRETYFIVVIKRNESNKIEGVTPVLNPNSDIFVTLIKNIEEKHFVKKPSSSLKFQRRVSSASHSHASVNSKSRKSSGNI